MFSFFLVSFTKKYLSSLIRFMKKHFLKISIEELIIFKKLEKTLMEFVPLKSDFRLSHLAYLIDFPEHKTTLLIKKIYGNRFEVVVNQYRLLYFEDLMNRELFQEKKIIISDLIKKSGFRSKSTYYATLKRRNAS